MDSSDPTTLFTSSIVVTHNAFKNIIFRTATIILDFVILRLFGLLASRQGDYTSFLMFAEDLIQKAWFVSSRGITTRQSFLVAGFALVAAAGEFYDTMLWAIDNPGFVMQHRLVNGATLSSHILKYPSYVMTISGYRTQGSEINLNSSLEMDLYNPGFNFTLPGVFEEGTVEVAPPLFPLNPVNGTPRIWLDDEGLAVGVDYTFMSTPNMTNHPDTACYPTNSLNETDYLAWNCNVPTSEAEGIFTMSQGVVLIWWDIYHLDYLEPPGDNPWDSLGQDGGTYLMKQVFTITKGHRRHTFKQTVIKASMLTTAPETLDDGEVADFVRRTWSTYGGITTGVQDVVDTVLHAKWNNTGRTFGSLLQKNTSVASVYTDFLISFDLGFYLYSFLRFTLVNITLIRSETLEEAPIPSQPCPGLVYSNRALGGILQNSSCIAGSQVNQTLPLNQDPFLGLMDTASTAVFTYILGDGVSNLSSVALSQTGIDWVAQEESRIESHLISRAMLMGGNASAVMVDVGTTVAAISGLQLFLCILPGALAIVIWWFTRDPAMSYYQNPFLAAVLATTHTDAIPPEELGYIHSMPEITLRRRGKHLTLGTSHDGTISNTISTHMDESEMVYEPFILEQDHIWRTT